MSIHQLTLRTLDLRRGDHLVNPYPPGFEKVSIKPKRSGLWRVETFTVEAETVAMDNLRLIRDGYPQRIVPPGKYTRLVHGRGRTGVYGTTCVMSDTPAEAHEHVRALRAATGAVLLGGLGIGFVLNAILKKPDVTKVVVIEKSADVIKLTGPIYSGDRRVKIVEADINEWTPRKGTVFDFAWYDIWPAHLDEESVSEAYALWDRFQLFAKRHDYWSREYVGRT